MKRKFLPYLLITLLLVSLFPANVFSKEAGSSSNNSQIPLEKAVQIVKQNFTIPNGLNDFSSTFDNSGTGQRWRLNWSSPENQSENFTAEVDAVTGEIVNMHHWSDSAGTSGKTPALSALEAQRIGQELLGRLLPEKMPNLVLDNDSGIIPLGQYSSPKYNMRWKRTYHNIDVAMDYVSMEIDMQTGEVTDYYLNWTNQAFPEANAVISADQARQIFISADILKLQYRFIQAPAYISKEQAPQIKLVYAVRHPSNGIIDALTGKPLTTGGYNYSLDGAGVTGRMKEFLSSTDRAPVVITPEEQKEITSSAQYITQAKAVELAEKWLPSVKNMQLDSAALDKDIPNSDIRCWILNWSDKNLDPGKRSYIWAKLDASSGEIMAFNQNCSNDKPIDNTNIINRETALSLAEKFVKTIQPDRWSELKLSDIPDQTRPMDMNPPTWSFNYSRLVNGIICPDNGIEVAVDAGSQQVTSYYYNWSKNQFPSTQGAISSSQAIDTFLKMAPLKLSYTTVPDSKGIEEIRLVYMPQAKNGVAMIDANGSALDQEGKPITNIPRAYAFNDIKGHFGEKEINVLGQAGLFGEYETSFRPNEEIKLIALLRAMLSSKEGIYSTQRVNDEEIMRRCRSLHWVDKDASGNSSVSREQLAQLMIRFLNIDYLGQVQGIYQLPYKDAATMSPQLKAYAALCWGLGIIKSDGKTFNPHHTVTRAEAAVALLHTLSIKTQP